MNDSPLAHPEWLALVASMRFAPDDDTPRLVGADWLTETNRPELIAWGEFIRYQCEEARHPRLHPWQDSCDCTRCRCQRKAVTIADRWLHEWRWHTWDVAPVDAPLQMWQRGFVTVGIVPIEGPNLKRLVKCVPPMFERQPLRGMTSHIRHTHLTHRIAVSLVCRVETEIATLTGNVVVKAMLSRKDRPGIDVRGVRWARKPNQFAPAVSAAIGESLKKRHGLFPGAPA